MLRRAIFSSPSGRLLERGSIDHAIRVEHDQIDEGFWLKHAAVGKPQAPRRRSVIRFTAAARRAAARAGVDLIFHAYHLDDKCIDVEVGQRRPPSASHSRATSSISHSRTQFEIVRENRAKHTRPACRC
jgi:hypothetical protein